jgi:PST family polysaccharide transporter
MGSQAGVLVIGLATQSALAWWLGTAGRGSYAACVVFATILNVLFVVGFDVAIEVFVASRKLTPSEAVTYVFLCGAVSSVVAVAAGLVAFHLPIALLEKASRTQFLMALALVPLGMIATVLSRFPAALGRFGMGAFVQVGQLTVQLVLTVILVRGMGAGVEGAIMASAATSLLVVLGVPLLLGRVTTCTWVRPSLARLREIWSFGVRYYIGKISNLATVELGTVIVAMFVTRDEIGLFAVAAAVTARAEFIPNVLGIVILPRVASNGGGRPDLVAQCARVSTVVCAALLGVLVLFAPWIVGIVFSPAFLPAVPLIRIIAAGTLIRCAAKVVVPYLTSRNRPGLASAAVFTGMVVNVGVMLALLAPMGLPAAALGVSLSHLVSSAILLGGFRSVSGMPVRRFWEFQRSDWAPVTRALTRVLGGADRGPDAAGL